MIAAAPVGDNEMLLQPTWEGANVNVAESEPVATRLLAAIDKTQLTVSEFILKHGPVPNRGERSGNAPHYVTVVLRGGRGMSMRAAIAGQRR